MDFHFKTFDFRLLPEAFIREGDCKPTESTAVLTFYDETGKQLNELRYGYFSPETIQKINPSKLDQCFLSDECISAVKQSYAKSESKHGFSACKAFFSAENLLDFSGFSLHSSQIDFSESCFFAQNINFDNCSFEAEKIDFSNCRFFSDNISFSSVHLIAEKITFNNSKFSQGNKFFRDAHLISKSTEFRNISFNDGDVVFSGTNFGPAAVSFKISVFGEGKVDFSQTNFGNEEVSFEKTEFGKGDVSFRNAVFHDGKVNFISAIFGPGDKTFVGTNFGNGNIIFKNSKFSDGKVRFRMATFGLGRIDFHFSEFGKGDILFDSVHIQTGDIDFRAVDFGQGILRFKNLTVGDGDIIFENAKLFGELNISDTVFGKGVVNFDEAMFPRGSLYITNVDFGTGKVSFNQAVFDVLSMRNSQLDNFFDLRLKSCNMLDLSDTVVKDILNIDAQNFSANLKGLNLSGMRLLGRIYLDWKRANVSKLIHSQDTGNVIKAEQFRILKENYNVTGQYNYEDEAYVEFKRAEAKVFLEHDLQGSFMQKVWAWGRYGFAWLIFDKMGRYATDPLRVLVTMVVTFLMFSSLFLIISEFGDIHIVSSLYDADDPRVLSNIQKAFYHSAITFLTIGYGDYYPEGISRWISGIEGFVGLFLMSYFTVAFVRKVLR